VELLPLLRLLTVAASLIALAFSVVAIVRGRVRVTHSRTFRGVTARLMGMACIILTILFLWFSAKMWLLVDG
jgi:hypothetical protein